MTSDEQSSRERRRAAVAAAFGEQLIQEAARAAGGSSSERGLGSTSIEALRALLFPSDEGGEHGASLPRVGERLGEGERYEIEAQIGVGGMGIVFRARDHVLRRPCAIKLILTTPRSRGEGSVERFVAEAQLTARLEHPNIVTLFDMGVREGYPFLVLEHLSGRSLERLLEQERSTRAFFGHRPDPLVVLDRMIPVLDALAYAHHQGVFHRDLKPANLFHLSSGRVKILDFGLAVLEGEAPLAPSEPAAGVSDLRTTARLWAGGTPAYMSPEQWRGQPQDARSDVWAVGVMLFEMLADRHPFEPESVEGLRARVLDDTEAPSLCTLRDDLPRALTRLVERALVKDLSRRLARADALRDGLRAVRRSLLRLEITVRDPRDGARARVVQTGRNPVRVGRDATGDIVLERAGVASQHALLRMVAGQLIVEDLGSPEGTRVNGRRIDSLRAVGPRDLIGIAGYELEITRRDRPVHTSSPAPPSAEPGEPLHARHGLIAGDRVWPANSVALRLRLEREVAHVHVTERFITGEPLAEGAAFMFSPREPLTRFEVRRDGRLIELDPSWRQWGVVHAAVGAMAAREPLVVDYAWSQPWEASADGALRLLVGSDRVARCVPLVRGGEGGVGLRLEITSELRLAWISVPSHPTRVWPPREGERATRLTHEDASGGLTRDLLVEIALSDSSRR